MIWLLVAVSAVAGAVLNRIRGGWVKKAGVWIAAAALAGVVFLLTGQWLAPVVTAIAYVAGESFGWSKWFNVGGYLSQAQYNERWPWPKDKTGKEGPHYVAKLFFDETKRYWPFCVIGFAVRGLYWSAPVYASLWWFGVVGPVPALAAAVATAVAMPFSYWLGYRLNLLAKEYLHRAEFVYGAVQGSALCLAVAL